MKSTQVVWHEGSRLTVDYARQRINIQSIGDFDVARALKCKRFIFELFDQCDLQFDLFVDISLEGKQGRGVRKIWKEINNHPKVRHVALYGINSFAKLIHTMIVGFRKHPRVRLFTKKDVALEWVDQEIKNISAWFDTSRKKPDDGQTVVFEIDGVNYIGVYEASRSQFRAEDSLIDVVFPVKDHRILWRPYSSTWAKAPVEYVF